MVRAQRHDRASAGGAGHSPTSGARSTSSGAPRAARPVGDQPRGGVGLLLDDEEVQAGAHPETRNDPRMNGCTRQKYV